MTFKEKLAMEHPDQIRSDCEGGCVGCPGDYHYDIERCTDPDGNCERCWNREIPGTEQTSESINKKEKDIMATTRKTKEELLKELDEANTSITNLKKELADLEKHKQYDECADQLAAMRDSFIIAGFDKNEAFVLVQQVLANVMGANANDKRNIRYVPYK